MTKFRRKDDIKKKPESGDLPGCPTSYHSFNLLLVYLFPQVHRIELAILLSSWHTISSLIHARPFFLFYFVPFITHARSHSSPPHTGTTLLYLMCVLPNHSSCVYLLMCICGKYMVLMCFNLHKSIVL